MKNAKTFGCLASLGLMISVLGGCHHDDAPPKPEAQLYHGEDFQTWDENRSENKIMASQMSAGARADATLYPAHFDGAALTSLGTAKLDLMLKDSHSDNPIVIYLAVPADDFTMERRTTVSNYLMDRGGLKADQIKFADGANPGSYSPAVDTMKSFDGMDAGTSGSAPSSTGGASH